jgi:hypothetical protein
MSTDNSNGGRPYFFGDTHCLDRLIVETIMWLNKADNDNVTFGIALRDNEPAACHIVLWNNANWSKEVLLHRHDPSFTVWDLLAILIEKELLSLELDQFRASLTGRDISITSLRLHKGEIQSIWTLHGEDSDGFSILDANAYNICFSDKDRFVLWPLEYDNLEQVSTVM